MAAKKYLSLEEAAQVMGLRTDEVIRMRERGDLRGFADRGTWKFKADDVEEAKRRRQPDSNPDVPIIDDDTSVLDEDEQLGAQATMVRRGGPGSDSDVRLILDDNLQSKPLAGSSAEIPILKGPGSDSDVRLVGSPGKLLPAMGSDSDVKLLKPKTSDSKIRLSDSDSDVRLSSPGKGSDSDVKLVPSPGAGADDLPFDFNDSDSVLLDDDSGVRLPADSGVKLTGSSSLRLTADSGIRLSQPADSGILLEGPADSGIKLPSAGASGLGLGSGLNLAGGLSGPKLAGRGKTKDDLDVTAPMNLGPRPDMAGTDPDVPLMAADDDDDDMMPKLKGGHDDTHAETSVIMFDEDEEVDEVSATMVKKRGGAGLSGVNFDDSSSDVETTDEAYDDEELEVSDEILGEDDELEEMEVFDTEDTDFGDFDEGTSNADFTPRGAGKIAVADSEWSGGTVTLVAFSALSLVIGAMVGVDLLSTVWNGGGPMNQSLFMSTFGGLFK